MENYKILIVEDNEDIREGIRLLLGGENYKLLEAETGEDGLEKFSDDIDLVILDVMLPGISGLKVCEEIRKLSTVPIIFLTAKAQESDRLIGFMAGGDDYLVKPFTYSELLARVRAQLRRYHVYCGKQPKQKEFKEYIELGGMKISTLYNEVYLDDKRIDLSKIEYSILLLMMKNPRKLFSTKNLYESVWNEPYFYISNNTVMVHIRKLRMKIEKDPQNPRYIRTVWGKGYEFCSEEL